MKDFHGASQMKGNLELFAVKGKSKSSFPIIQKEIDMEMCFLPTKKHILYHLSESAELIVSIFV